MLGLYISGHPLEEYKSELEASVTMTTAEFATDTEADAQETGDSFELNRVFFHN